MLFRSSLLLNLAPDRRGQIPDADAKSLADFRQRLDAMFKVDLARGAKAAASNVRGADPKFAAENVLPDHAGQYWATDDAVTNAQLVVEFSQPSPIRSSSICPTAICFTSSAKAAPATAIFS